jgi:hypothetical protein
MLNTRISDIFQVRSRFIRSVHLERDFRDPDALQGYVLTPSAKTGLQRLSKGLAPLSTQRAWRITGDFGTGKSSFALALAHLFAGHDTELPLDLRRNVDFSGFGMRRPNFLPVLVTGSRKEIGPCPSSGRNLLAREAATNHRARPNSCLPKGQG